MRKRTKKVRKTIAIDLEMILTAPKIVTVKLTLTESKGRFKLTSRRSCSSNTIAESLLIKSLKK
jgi:hypothetical protein